MTLMDDAVSAEPVPAARRSRHGRWRWVGAVAGPGALLTAALAIAAIPTGESGSTVLVPNAPLPSATAPEPAPPVAPERLSASSRLRLDGIGPVLVGMSLDEASAAAGMAFGIVPNSDRIGTGACAYAAAEGGPEGVSFMVVNGRIVRIDVTSAHIRTVSGIGAGSTEADVLAAYPDRIRVQPNPYAGHRGARDLVYVPDEGSRHLGFLFQADGGRVNSFRSGLSNAVMAPEGCA